VRVDEAGEEGSRARFIASFNLLIASELDGVGAMEVGFEDEGGAAEGVGTPLLDWTWRVRVSISWRRVCRDGRLDVEVEGRGRGRWLGVGGDSGVRSMSKEEEGGESGLDVLGG